MRPRLLGGNDRRRTPRAMQGAARMRSIVRVRVHPVLIGRDAERRPPVQLRAVWPPGGSLPALRQGPPLLFAALQRAGAAAVSASCGAALPGQPPSQACRAALPRTPAMSAGPRAESDASPFDRRTVASCCDAHAGGAIRSPALWAWPSRQSVPLRSLRAVLRPCGLSGPAREGSEMVIDKQTRAEILRLYFAEKWKIGTIARQHSSQHGRPYRRRGRGARASERTQALEARPVPALHPRDPGDLAALQPALPDGRGTRLPGQPLPQRDRPRASQARGRGLSAPQRAPRRAGASGLGPLRQGEDRARGAPVDGLRDSATRAAPFCASTSTLGWTTSCAAMSRPSRRGRACPASSGMTI